MVILYVFYLFKMFIMLYLSCKSLMDIMNLFRYIIKKKLIQLIKWSYVTFNVFVNVILNIIDLFSVL